MASQKSRYWQKILPQKGILEYWLAAGVLFERRWHYTITIVIKYKHGVFVSTVRVKCLGVYINKHQDMTQGLGGVLFDKIKTSSKGVHMPRSARSQSWSARLVFSPVMGKTGVGLLGQLGSPNTHQYRQVLFCIILWGQGCEKKNSRWYSKVKRGQMPFQPS